MNKLSKNILFEFDLSQAENRIVAYIAPDQTMIQTFEAGIDVHKKTASLIFQCSIEAVTPEQRDKTGKPSNHSLNYDMGYRSFGLKYMIPETRAKEIVEAYHRAYPGVRQYHGWVQGSIKQNRTLTNLLGRKRRFLGRMGDSLFKEAYAWTPQSTVADIINERGMLFIWEDAQLQKDITLLNQVHDSVVFEADYESKELLYSNLLRIKNSLETPILWKGREFTIPAELKMGFRLGKKYTKIVNLKTYETFDATLMEIIQDASKVI